jgi:hypothetical protein
MNRFPRILLLLATLFLSSITLAKTKLNTELHPYYFLNEKELNGFIHFNLENQKRINSKSYYKIKTNADISNLKNSLDQNYFINLTGTKYLSRSKPFVFSFGFLEHNYGLSKISSPLDYVDQKSYYDLINPRRFSDPSLRLSFKLGETLWRISYIPIRFKMPFPGNKSFWLPRKLPPNVKDEGNTVEFPNNPTYEWQDYKNNKDSNKNNFSLIGEYKAEDWQWVWQYYQGLDTDTNIELELNTNTISGNTVRTEYPILLHPIHNKIQRLGFGFVYTTPIKWRVIFENSISLGDSNNSDIATEKHTYNSSLSLEWGLPVFGDILYGIIQGFYGKSSNAQSGSTSILPPLQEALLFGILWKKRSYELNLGFIKSYSLDVNVIQSSITYNLNQNFYIKTSSVIIYGPIPELLSGFVDSDIVDTYLGYQTQF